MDFTHAQAAHKPTAMALHLVDHLFKKDVLFKSTVHGTKEYAPPDQDIITAIRAEVQTAFAYQSHGVNAHLHMWDQLLSGQATDALNDGCEERLTDGNKDLMQFFEEIIKCLSEENYGQCSTNTDKWIQLSRVFCEICGQLGDKQNIQDDHLVHCREGEENYFANGENSSCVSYEADSDSVSNSENCGGSINWNMQGNGGIHDDEPELYSGSRCNTIYVNSTVSSQLGATGHGSECESPLLVEKAEKKEIDQDPRPTDTLSYDKVENWLQFTCSANGLPSLSPYIPESSDSDHNDTLTLLNCVESARAIMEGRKKRRRATNWWSRGGKHEEEEGEKQISRRDGAKKDYKVEKWLKVVCAAKGLSAGELTSFLSCNVPSSLDAAHNDELSLLKGVETVRVRLPGRGERERDAKSSYSGEKNDVQLFKGDHQDVAKQAEA